jgi:hypothetical protein
LREIGGTLLGGFGSNRGIRTSLAIAQRLAPRNGRLTELPTGQWNHPKAYLARRGSAASSKAAGDPQVHSLIEDIMESFIDPSADVVLERRERLSMPGREPAPVGTESEAPGVELEPAEITALIKKGRRSLDVFSSADLPPDDPNSATTHDAQGVQDMSPKTPEEWLNAKALQDLGLEALRGTEAKDVPSLEDIGDRMENVCESCHQTFWYPQEKHASRLVSVAKARFLRDDVSVMPIKWASDGP